MADPARAQAETPYPTGLYLPGHPDLLAACARLHGLEPADPERCRYLDLGCGDGTNALAVADSLPGSECLGIDVAPSAIARGEELRAELGLGNVELRAADLADAEVEPGSWDYVVMHGLLSWVPGEVRAAALELAASALAPGGVAMASYNALPGWHALRPAQDLARRHAAAAGPDAADRAAAAHRALQRTIAIGAAEQNYLALIREALERYEEMDDEVLLHDDLAEPAEPLHLRAVAELAAASGLDYVGEALPDHWWRHVLPPEASLQIVAATGPEAIDRQEEADAVFGHVFKATLFAPAGAEIDAVSGPDWRHAGSLHLVPIAEAEEEPGSEGSEGSEREQGTSDEEEQEWQPEGLREAALALERAAPLGLSVDELAARAGLDDETAAQAALRLCAGERAWPSAAPPRFAYPAPERPLVPKLSRIVAARSGELPTLGWDTLELATETGRVLISLLDGSRDRDELVAALRERGPELGIEQLPDDRLRRAVEARLEELARAGGLAPG